MKIFNSFVNKTKYLFFAFVKKFNVIYLKFTKKYKIPTNILTKNIIKDIMTVHSIYILGKTPMVQINFKVV